MPVTQVDAQIGKCFLFEVRVAFCLDGNGVRWTAQAVVRRTREARKSESEHHKPEATSRKQFLNVSSVARNFTSQFYVVCSTSSLR